MRIYKSKKIEVLDEVTCDICGESCSDVNFGHECAHLVADWGYASRQDGIKYEVDFCEKCFGTVMDFLKTVRKIKPDGYDPLNPESAYRYE
jgi:hypothetical protein